LHPVDGLDRIWSDYRRLVRRLLDGTIPLRYKDDSGKKKDSLAPSLAIHPAWRNLRRPAELPRLPQD
jgi:hypothetical protein